MHKGLWGAQKSVPFWRHLLPGHRGPWPQHSTVLTRTLVNSHGHVQSHSLSLSCTSEKWVRRFVKKTPTRSIDYLDFSSSNYKVTVKEPCCFLNLTNHQKFIQLSWSVRIAQNCQELSLVFESLQLWKIFTFWAYNWILDKTIGPLQPVWCAYWA